MLPGRIRTERPAIAFDLAPFDVGGLPPRLDDLDGLDLRDFFGIVGFQQRTMVGK